MTKRKTVTQAALVVSILLIALWILLSTNASLAWFQADDTLVNSLYFGNFDVNVYYKTGDGYEPVDNETRVFSDEALYEPGYTQVVYLKIENAGTVDFDYAMSVIPDLANVVVGKNEMGGDIFLPDHLNFGLVFDSTEEGLMEKTADRDLARTCATQKLSNYEEGGSLAAGSSDYCALVLYMPEEVANEANYRGDTVPSAKVGISVLATAAD